MSLLGRLNQGKTGNSTDPPDRLAQHAGSSCRKCGKDIDIGYVLCPACLRLIIARLQGEVMNSPIAQKQWW